MESSKIGDASTALVVTMQDMTLCPGAQSTDNKVEYYTVRIADGWRKSVDHILANARECASAWAVLDSMQRKELLLKLRPIISREDFSKLAAIGRNHALYIQKIRKKLPAKWTIIHKLRHLTADELDQAVQDRMLSPSVSRERLEEWIDENSSHRQEERRRAAQSNACNHSSPDQVGIQELCRALQQSPELIAAWQRSSPKVRSKFTRSMLTGECFHRSDNS